METLKHTSTLTKGQKVSFTGHTKTPVIVEIPTFVETTWELRTYDVWGDAENGYEVNNTFRAGEVTIRCAVERNNAGTPRTTRNRLLFEWPNMA